MKKRIYGLLAPLCLLAGMTACEDALDTTSEGYVFDKDHSLSAANDSLYSAMGILSRLQTLGEKYVTYGELRGDLVSVPATAPIAYQRINAFETLDADDAAGMKRDFYSVINNCNIALARMDTTVTEHGSQVLMPEYAAIRTMRDWTLLQLGLAYGEASFADGPILDVEAAESNYGSIALDELVRKLIADLEPLAARNTPNYGNIDGFSSKLFFIKPALLLGDLYLYNGNYREAAAMYYKVIKDEGYVVSVDNANHWTTSVRNESIDGHSQTYTSEAVSIIPYASDAKKYHPDMVNLTYNRTPAFTPATWFVNEMSASQHYHIDRLGITNISGYLEGDLRGAMTDRDGVTTPSAYGDIKTGTDGSECLITKFMFNGTLYSSVTNPNNPLMENGAILCRSIALYRIPHIYLRYAEAVNRAGKPSLAFAVLKYGLRSEVLDDETKVAPEELADQEAWTNFSDPTFDRNYGTAMRGRGLGIAVEQTDYVLPETDDKDELIEWVEDRILDEMASETGFEGNRFFDLLRISRHRAAHPQYMVKKIARRFDNPAAIESKLSDISALWIK
ncbi:MAG: RagB/SusD family nutrient uptake outer membrane protein [Muribaculaceae bacterium]|nr:RagB/SusD family nutrient uptake outer membrane protein [Muribaculaceae bacterium]